MKRADAIHLGEREKTQGITKRRSACTKVTEIVKSPRKPDTNLVIFVFISSFQLAFSLIHKQGDWTLHVRFDFPPLCHVAKINNCAIHAKKHP